MPCSRRRAIGAAGAGGADRPFQNACRDICRRAGIAAVAALAGEPFDPKRHQLLHDAAAPDNALVLDTLAPGYTYQGQLVRRALVRLQEGEKTNDKL